MEKHLRLASGEYELLDGTSFPIEIDLGYDQTLATFFFGGICPNMVMMQSFYRSIFDSLQEACGKLSSVAEVRDHFHRAVRAWVRKFNIDPYLEFFRGISAMDVSFYMQDICKKIAAQPKDIQSLLAGTILPAKKLQSIKMPLKNLVKEISGMSSHHQLLIEYLVYVQLYNNGKQYLKGWKFNSMLIIINSRKFASVLPLFHS